MPRHATQEISLALHDFSRGIVGGVSERGTRNVNWAAACDNLYGRPFRGLRVRPGSRDLSTAVLSDSPHSLMAFYSGGGNKLFVAAANRIFEIGGASYALQTLPGSHPATSDIFLHTNLDGILVATQRGGALTPLRYNGVWEELKLPKPTLALTFNVNAAGGNVDVGTHYYRVRWRYANGSSLAGPGAAAPAVVGGSGNYTISIATNLVPGSPRGDYIGWTLERTKVNGSANGPWWFVADGTAGTYLDAAADASLGYMADEGLHGEPHHFDGITSFTNRLWGWAGSYLYASQAAFGDLEATGIANFDADLTYPVSKDDGDTIQVCLVVGDELLILKKRSVHVISGIDPDSYVLTDVVFADPSRGSEAGCGGPRAACVIGGVAYFWGESGGLFTYSRGSVKPVAWLEMGRYFDELNTAAIDNLLLINHQGNYMLAWYPRAAVSTAIDQIVRDVRLGQWWHWSGWAARDAIELKSGILGAASMAFCDPRNRSSFPAILAGRTITGSGIPPATTVSAPVAAGDTTLTMSANATATAQNVTLTIDGVATPHCNTTIASPTVTISSYHCWSGFDGFQDEKPAGAGTTGTPPATSLESPWLDLGMPDEWKDLDRISFSSEGDVPAVTIAVTTDPDGGGCAVSMPTTGSGADWALEGSPASNDLEWDVGDWAAEAPGTVAAGLPAGTIGRRFKLTMTANPAGDFRPSGIELVATLLPDKEYNV